MISASDRKSVRALEKAAKLAEVQRLDFVRQIMSTIPGRQWMWDRLERCHVFTNPFASDTHSTAFACGEMNVGQQLLADIMLAAPDSYITAAREANERNAAAESARSKDADRRDQGRESGDDADSLEPDDVGDETGAVYYENGRAAI